VQLLEECIGREWRIRALVHTTMMVMMMDEYFKILRFLDIQLYTSAFPLDIF